MSYSSPPGSVTVVRPSVIPLPPAGGEQGFTLLSDLHLGASNVQLGEIKAELDEAKTSGDRILLNGDVFDLILPRDHKRYDPTALHPRIRGRSDVVNAVLDWGEELLAPYALHLDMIGVGNHEATCEKNNSVDVVSLLVNRLNGRLQSDGHLHRIARGGYCGFVDYRFRNPSHHSSRFLIFYHHGTGKGSSLASSLTEFDRFRFVDGADVFWLGHKHSRVSGHVSRIACPLSGTQLIEKEVRLVRTGAYLRTYSGVNPESLLKSGRKSNYAADWGMPNHGRGGARLVLKFNGDRKYTLRVVQ